MLTDGKVKRDIYSSGMSAHVADLSEWTDCRKWWNNREYSAFWGPVPCNGRSISLGHFHHSFAEFVGYVEIAATPGISILPLKDVNVNCTKPNNKIRWTFIMPRAKWQDYYKIWDYKTYTWVLLHQFPIHGYEFFEFPLRKVIFFFYYMENFKTFGYQPFRQEYNHVPGEIIKKFFLYHSFIRDGSTFCIVASYYWKI